jgi:hypothetical protein
VNIFVPATNLLDPTRYCLRDYDYTVVDVSKDDEAYYRYFKDRWKENKTFISVEQDVIFWPGALESLWNCPSKWCAFPYEMLGVPLQPHAYTPLGLVKFSDYFIDETPTMLEELESKHWKNLDSGIAHWVEQSKGQVVGCHMHWPSVVNYHPELA